MLLGITWLATLMIIWKLWQVGAKTMRMTDRRENKYLTIIFALVESGMLISVVMGVFAGLWFASLVSTFFTYHACGDEVDKRFR